ncbi:hypothetical protein T484DRAFT_2291120 [Baffinella frigidus]|nr:hypothetical protein T484DRAFT_2291120 [Cryptophyta sp. CCMP2293]
MLSRPEAHQTRPATLLSGALLKIASMLALLSCTAGVQSRVALLPRSRGQCLQQAGILSSEGSSHHRGAASEMIGARACGLVVGSRRDFRGGPLRLRGGVGRTAALLAAAEGGDAGKVAEFGVRGLIVGRQRRVDGGRGSACAGGAAAGCVLHLFPADSFQLIQGGCVFILGATPLVQIHPP